MNEQQQKEAPANGMWAIVEIFGHQRIAGWMTKQTIAGQGFIRVDVPEVAAELGGDGPIAAHSKLYGPGAIYSINPVDQTVATIAAKSIRHVPVSSYGLRDVLRNMPDDQRQRLLAAPEDDDPWNG